MAGGKKRVERIPKDWVDDVRRRVEAGRALQDALREVLTANAELLVLRRKQQPRGRDHMPAKSRTMPVTAWV